MQGVRGIGGLCLMQVGSRERRSGRQGDDVEKGDVMRKQESKELRSEERGEHTREREQTRVTTDQGEGFRQDCRRV